MRVNKTLLTLTLNPTALALFAHFAYRVASRLLCFAIAHTAGLGRIYFANEKKLTKGG